MPKLAIVSTYNNAGLRNAERDLRKLSGLAATMNNDFAAGAFALSGSLSNFSAATGAMAATMTRNLTVPLALLGGYGVQQAISFESAWAGVTKTVDGSEEQLSALRTGIRDMAKELPTTRETIAGVAEAAGQLGIETDNVLGFTRTMIDLSETTILTADEAATAFARFANIVQMPQDDFDRLGSSVVALGNNMATTEAEISEFGLRIAGAGKQVGLTEPEIMAVGAALSSVGIEAEAGGTAISKTMIGIESAVQKGGDDLTLWAETAGMSAAQFKQAWEKDPADALNSVITGLGRMEAQGGSTLQQLENLGITEARQRDALLRAAGAGDLLTNALKISGDAWDSNSALAEEAAKRYETPESRLLAAKNAASDAAMVMGANLLPSIVRIAEAGADLAEKFGNLSPNTQDLIVKFGVMVAAAGPVLGMVSKIAGGLAVLTKGAGLVSLALQGGAGKLPLYARAMAAPIAGLKNFTTGLTNASAGASAFATPATKLGGAMRTAASSVGQFTVNIVKQGAALVVSSAKWVAQTAAMVAHKTASLAVAAGAKVLTAAQWLLNAAMTANPIGIVVALLVGLGVAFVALWKKSETFRNIVTGAWEAIKNSAVKVWEWLVGAFKKWGTLIMTALLGPVGMMVVNLIKNWDKIKAGAKEKLEGLIAFVKSVPSKIKAAIGNLGSLLVQAGKDVIEGLKRGVQEKWEAVKSFFANIGSNVAQAFKNALGIKSPSKVMREAGQDTADGVILGLRDRADKVYDEGRRFGSSAVGGISTMTDAAYSAVVGMRDAEIEALEAKQNLAKAQQDLNDAIREYGEESDEARLAQLKLDKAAEASAEKQKSFETSVTKSTEKVNKFGTDVEKVASYKYGEFAYKSGQEVVTGLINGMTSKQRALKTAMRELAQQGVKGNLAKYLQIESPSRLTAKLGAYTGEGFVNGILGQVRPAGLAAQSLAASAAGALNASGSPQFGGAGGGNVTISPGAITINLPAGTPEATARAAADGVLGALARELGGARVTMRMAGGIA